MATKQELKDRLDELGIDYDDSVTNAELEVLIPEEDTSEDTSEDTGADDSSDDSDDSSDEEEDSVIVEWRGRERTFSKKVHGKDFLKLADQFAKKFDGTIK